MIRDPGIALLNNLSRGIVVAVMSGWCFMQVSATAVADPLLQSFESHEKLQVDSIDVNKDPLHVLMQSIVTVESIAIPQARSSKNFGAARQGSGVVLDANGLVVTAGYLVAEAQSVKVTFNDGVVRQARVVAYDIASGLGLIRVSGNQHTIPMELGNSARIRKDDIAMIIPAGGEINARAVKIGKVKKYSGGWEYIVDDAIHTYPPSTEFTGAALVSESAKLLGIGGLVTIDIDIDPKVRVPGNIFIPINSLKSVIGQLLTDGRSQASKRPWIGLDTKRTKQGVAVASMEADGPAKLSGLRSGDIIVAVAKKKTESQIDFYEKVWQLYQPGDTLELLVVRGKEYLTINIESIDFYDWLREPGSITQISEFSE